MLARDDDRAQQATASGAAIRSILPRRGLFRERQVKSLLER